MDQKKSTASIVAVLLALGSFFLTFSGHGLIALVCAILAIPIGLWGALAALSPKTSGGIMSVSAVGLAACGIGFAIVGLIVSLIF